jgi:hypothetical protein
MALADKINPNTLKVIENKTGKMRAISLNGIARKAARSLLSIKSNSEFLIPRFDKKNIPLTVRSLNK